MAANTEGQPMQEFQRRSSEDVVRITTRVDPRTKERVVLWRDIQSGIKNAESIWNGNSLVSFLTDDNLEEIIPLRIAYHPGVVLEVDVDGHSQLNPELNFVNLTPAARTSSSDLDAQTSDENTADNDISVRATTALVLTDNKDSSSLATCPASQPSLYDIMSVQANMQLSMDRNFEQLQMEMAKNMKLQELLVQSQLLQQQANSELTKTTVELLKNQEEIKEMQKVALDRLATIQSRIQAVITQTYELHEYPIPRLFIVLPKATGLFDKITNPFSNQFRLYFLCECGTHTMDANSRTQHEIHLAKHEGYDLERPNEFFERYGSYILTLLNMIKYGVSAAGLFVSPLSNFKIIEGIDTTREQMDYLKKNISPLVDNTIEYLSGIKRKIKSEDRVAEGHTELDQLEALEGADLRQLESYLRIKDKGRVLANLYRVVTPEGHAKWVCFDHYRATYRESAIRELREIVNVNRGTYIEEIGRIEIKLSTSIVAKQFYDAMVKARGIQELEVTLEWDATMSDLRSFAEAATKANVVHLVVDGYYLKGPPLDVVNRNHRFNPILQLASNTRIQSLQLKEFEHFFSRISKSALTPSPKLRIFEVGTQPISNPKTLQTINDFLEHCSALTTLELNIHPQLSIIGAIHDILHNTPSLESLKIGVGEQLLLATISNGKIQEVEATVERLGCLDFRNLGLILEEHLTRLSVNNVPEEDNGRLGDILLSVPGLRHLRVGCGRHRSLPIIDRVLAERNRAGLPSLKTLEVMKGNLVPFNTAYSEGRHVQSYLTFSDNSSTFDMRTWVRGNNTESREFVRQYGWSLVFYDGEWSDDITFAQIRAAIVNTNNPQLESLKIRSNPTGVDCFDEIIQRSPNFKDLGLYVDLDLRTDFMTAKTLLVPHGAILSTLSLRRGGGFPEGWSWISSTFPTRSSFPILESIILEPRSEFPPSSDCISWITAMVSAPSPPLVSSSHSPLVTEDVDVQRTWTSLKEITLDSVTIQPEEWRLVIEAIDFSELRVLRIVRSNFCHDQLKLLISRISDNNTVNIPLKTLDISDTSATKDLSSPSLLDELRRKLPSVMVLGD
ncbi:hypothetical protein B0O80DRAFT_501582 [Mortierella sp. GBAus27b]|nr:hypothetical protein BGX31_006596 [Mortierella sp. GBA43]KAI8349168.1 hypothetical protein B0O80DRAFT_501582 [Mortierella sp. GBAus27b]